MVFITQGPTGEQAPYGVNKTNWKFILIVVILSAIVGCGILVYQNRCLTKEEAQFPEIKMPEKTKDETADWEIYKNEKIGYSIKYPSDFKIDENAGGPIFYKGEKLITPPGSPIDPYPSLSLGILSRGKDCGDCSGFQLEDVTVAGYRAVKAITPGSTEDIWVYSSNNDKVVRIIYSWKNLTKEEQAILEKMLLTFKFIEPEEISTKEETCTISGGTVKTSSCCESASDFPNLCLIGPCGCGPQNSHQIKTCDCGPDKCFNGNECVKIQNP